MPYVQSEAIMSLAYDETAQRLRATFRGNGRTYEYADVPQQLYDGLILADSIGHFFNAHIRDRYDYREIRAVPETLRRPVRSASSAWRSSSSAAISNFVR